MKILLTGGTGFLGSNLLRRLVASGHTVALITRRTSDTWRIEDSIPALTCYLLRDTDLDQLFCQEGFDCVIHCATNYGRRETDITAVLESNLIMPLQLLQLSRKYGVTRFFNTDTILDKRVSSYSLSKGQFKEWLKRFSDDLCCVNVALEHFYGPLDDRSKFVTLIVKNLLESVAVLPLTRGEQKRDFIFIDDVVEAFVAIIERGSSADRGYYSYEIGSGQNVQIGEFVRLVKTLTGNTATHLDFGALPYRENEVMKSHVDLHSIMDLGWQPVVTLEEGLARTIERERKELCL
jgi:nucleoside-diphosphate-sugar epimerase